MSCASIDKRTPLTVCMRPFSRVDATLILPGCAFSSVVLLLGLIWTGCSQEAAGPQPVPTAEAKPQGQAEVVLTDSQEISVPTTEKPELPRPSWSVVRPDRPMPSAGAESFPVRLLNGSLRGECAGDAKRGASKGMQLELSGLISNGLTDMVHRATLTVLVYLDFSDEMVILRASSGNGLYSEPTSDLPWKAGTELRFSASTRAIDPIYCEYVPREALAAIHLSLETPLGFRFEGVVWAAPFEWSTIRGTHVDASATVLMAGTAKTSLNQTKLPAGAPVHLAFVYRDQALLDDRERILGWFELRALALDAPQLPRVVMPPATSTLIFERAMTTLTLSDFERGERSITARVMLENTGAKPAPCEVKSLVLLTELGSLQPVLDPVLAEGCAARIAPESALRGTLTFSVRPASTPLALEFKGGEVRGFVCPSAISTP